MDRASIFSRRRPQDVHITHVVRDQDPMVVFVHGFRGDPKNTWGAFPRMLRCDPDLPNISTHSYSYRSGFWPRHPGIPRVAEMLATNLRHIQERQERTLCLVGHSLGGLVILETLRIELMGGRARRPPSAVVGAVVLYASPVEGSQAARIVTTLANVSVVGRVFLKTPGLKWLVNEGIRDLAAGSTFCGDLIRFVVGAIYHPKIPNESADYRRDIRIRACVADGDMVVSRESVEGVFSDPPVDLLAGDHRSIKLPEADRFCDERYLPVKHEIEKSLIGSFKDRCDRIVNGDAEHSDYELGEFLIDYGNAIKYRLRHVFPNYVLRPSQEQRELDVQFAGLTCKFGLHLNCRPSRALDAAYQALRTMDFRH